MIISALISIFTLTNADYLLINLDETRPQKLETDIKNSVYQPELGEIDSETRPKMQEYEPRNNDIQSSRQPVFDNKHPGKIYNRFIEKNLSY